MAKFLFSAFADEASADILEQIAACKANGIEYIELRNVNGKNISNFTVEEAKELKKLLDDNGIKVSSIGSHYGKIEITDDFVNAGYVYPINATASKMSGKTENSGTRKQKIPLSNRSHIELVKEILSLPDVYSQLVDEFGYCFMSIY